MPDDRPRGRRALAAAVASVAVVAIAACGDDAELERDTELRRALGEVGSAVSPTGAGFGWVHAARIRRESGPASLVQEAAALGPGGDQLFEEARVIARRTGLDPLAARQALSLRGSYTFAVRLDRVSPGRLRRELRRAGARSRRVAGWTGFDLGPPAHAVTAGPLSALDAFAARAAIERDSLVLSRMDGARASLTGAGGSVLDHEPLDLATACLGEVAAARTFPGGFAYNRRAAPDLVAVGVRPADGPGRVEVLCAIDDSADDAERRADAMADALREGGHGAVTGEPVARVVDEAVSRPSRTGTCMRRELC